MNRKAFTLVEVMFATAALILIWAAGWAIIHAVHFFLAAVLPLCLAALVWLLVKVLK